MKLLRIGQRANCFSCGLENIWLTTLVHEYCLNNTAHEMLMTSHTYNFGGALPPFLESWGGSSPSSSPLPPPLHCHGLLNLQVLITVKRYTKLHHYTELMSICLAMCILMARLCVYSHEGTFLYSVTFRYKKVPIIRFVVSKSLYSSCLSSHHSQKLLAYCKVL